MNAMILITTTPPLNEGLVLSTDAIFPQVVSGGGYTTQFILFGHAGSGKLYLFSRDGILKSASSLTAKP